MNRADRMRRLIGRLRRNLRLGRAGTSRQPIGEPGATTEAGPDPPRPGAPPRGPGREPEHRQAIRRAAYLALALVAAGLTVRAVIGERGLLEAHRARIECEKLEAEVGKWRERNAYLETRIQALRNDPATIERIARERLDYVRPGEITFLFPYDAAAPEPFDPGPVAPGEFGPTQPGDPVR